MRETNKGTVPAPSSTTLRTLLALFTALSACGRSPAPAPVSPIQHLIERAADEENVPRPLLLALAWVESRGSMNPGQRSVDGAWGLFHLIDGPDAPAARSLLRAARLVGLPPERLRNEAFANALGGAALLRAQGDLIFGQYRDLKEERLGDWYEAVMLDSALADAPLANSFAAQVYRVLRDGLTGANGGALRVAPQSFDLDGRAPWVDQSQDLTGDYCPGGACVRYVQAPNYTGGHGGLPVQFVVIHDMEGYYESSIQYFTHPSTQVSAHYMLRSSDGAITQMVRDGDTAWHAGDWNTNQRSIGIEHEGFAASGNQWYSEAMYRSSAALTRWLSDAYQIPKDRQHIIGHYEVPNPNAPGLFGGSGAHHDPCDSWAGAATWHNVTRCFWDWNHYLALVGGAAGPPPPTSKGLAGRITSQQTGAGIGGALVSVSSGGHAQSDGAGNYSLAAPAGAATMTVKASGYFAQSFAVTVGGAGLTTRDVALAKAPTLAPPSLTIDDPSEGDRFESSPIEVSGTVDDASVSQVTVNGVAAPVVDGAFTTQLELHEGANTITASAANAGGTGSVAVQVSFAAVHTGVQGAVLDGSTARPIAGAAVTFGAASTRTDAAGHFALDAAPGDGELKVSAAGYQDHSETVGVPEQGLVDVEISLDAGGGDHPGAPQVFIFAPADGDIVSEAAVSVQGAVDDPTVSSVLVAGVPTPVVEGKFDGSAHLKPGANTIEVRAHNALGSTTATVKVTYVAPVSGLKGTVTAAGAPVAFAVVALQGAHVFAQTGADGTYRLDAAPGSYTLAASAAGFAEVSRAVELSAGSLATEDLQLTAAPAGAPRVFIADPADGAVLQEARLVIRGVVDDARIGSVQAGGASFPALHGIFEAEVKLAPGSNVLTVSATGAGGTGAATVAVVYDIPRTGLAGHVSSAGDGVAIAGAVLLLEKAGHGESDFGGHYQIDAAPGSYTLTVSAAGYVAFERPVSVGADGLVDVDVLLVPSAVVGHGGVHITSPETGSTVHEGLIMVKGQSDVAGLASLSVNGKPVQPDATGAFSAQVTLSPGDNQIYARAIDTDGHSYADAIYLTWPVPAGTPASPAAGCGSAGADPLALLLAPLAGVAAVRRRRHRPALRR